MAEFLELKDITKIYGNGVIANDHVNFSLRRGEIHAVAGENGAGKSTVMKILYGLEKKDSGQIFIDGRPVTIKSPQDSSEYGIGMVHQHFMLVKELSVWENIFLGMEQTKYEFLRKRDMCEEVLRLSEKYGMSLDPHALCGTLPVGLAQKVEILKVLARGARILILDEPTSVLTPQETKQLFVQLKLLKQDNCSIIIITHKLKEIKEICDRVTILRGGRNCGVFNVAQVTEADISRLMIGAEVNPAPQKQARTPGRTVLTVKNLRMVNNNGKTAVKGISFCARAGEILCFAGVEGNGQQETVRAVTGLQKYNSGEVKILGEAIGKKNIREIRALGVAHIPEDRIKTGLNEQASVYDNLISAAVSEKSKKVFLPGKKLKKWSLEQIRNYKIKADSISVPVGALSGGNMQKVIAAREMETNPVLLVCDQPTRGVDVGAAEFIHREIINLRDKGVAVLLISADLSEVFRLADRILVFHDGEITAHITDIEKTSEEQLGKYMLGLEKMDRKAVDLYDMGETE